MDSARQKPEDRLADIEAINNLDLARMSLRWALERIRALERSQDELARALAQRDQVVEALQEERGALKRQTALRGDETRKREEYYERMREFITIRLTGKPDAAALASRELELARLQEELHARAVALEKEFAAKNEAARLELEAHKSALAQEARRQAERARQEQALIQARQDEAAAAREAEFEACREEAQRQAHQRAGERVREAEEEAARLRAAYEGDWKKEKDDLLAHLAERQRKIEEQRGELTTLRRELDETRDALLQRSRDVETATRGFEQDRQALARATQARGQEAELWRDKYREAEETAAQASRKAIEAEQALQELHRTLAAEAKRRELAEERADALEANFKRRKDDLDAIELSLVARLKDLEEDAQRRDEAWTKREEALRRREQERRRGQEEWQRMILEKSQQIESLKRELAETIRTYARGQGREHVE